MSSQPRQHRCNSQPYQPGGEAGLPLAIDKLVFGGQLKNGFFIEAGSQVSWDWWRAGHVTQVLTSDWSRTPRRTPTLSTSRLSTGGAGCWWRDTRCGTCTASPGTGTPPTSTPASAYTTGQSEKYFQIEKIFTEKKYLPTQQKNIYGMKKYLLTNKKKIFNSYAIFCRPSWVDFDWESSGGASVTAMSGLVPEPTQTSMRLQVSCDWWRAGHVTTKLISDWLQV